MQIRTTVRATGAKPAFVVTPSSRTTVAAETPHPSLRTKVRGTSRTGLVAAGSPSNPVEAERYCSVPRNDVRNQAMQPKPRQVEWAVDQAVRGALTTPRPANWKNLGMPAYTPAGAVPAAAR